MRRLVGAAVALGLSLMSASPGAGVAGEPEIVPQATRNVTPPGMTPGPVIDGPLIRDEDPAIQLNLPPPPPERPHWHRFTLPDTTDAATFVTRDRTIRIAGIVALPRSTSCRRTVDGDWPCGDVALAAFRHFLLGRPVECQFLNSDKSNPIVAPCRIGRIDIAGWLLTQGWVKAADDASDAYRYAAAATARCAGRGLWHSDEDAEPPAACPPMTGRGPR